MNRAFTSSFFLLLTACAFPPLTDPAPLATRNQHPVQLTVLHLGPRAARALPGGEVEVGGTVDWTSMWLLPGEGRDRIELDGELVRIGPGLRVGLGSGVDVRVEVPLLHASGGVLDGFIEAWHEVFILPQNRRDEFPRDRFVARAHRRDVSGPLQTAYDLDETSLRLGDIPIEVAWFPEAMQGKEFQVGFRAGLELPTGNEDRGHGNGEVDGGVGIVAGWRHEAWAITGWGGWSWVGTPDMAKRAGLGYGDVPSLGIGLEVSLVEGLSCLSQIQWERSVLRELDNDHARSDQALLWLGGRYRFSPRHEIELAVGEDLIRNVSTDVTLHLGLRMRF
jgi:hypothetical protein